MLRSVMSIVAGLTVAFAFVFATDALFHAMASQTALPALNSREMMADFVAGQSLSTLMAVVAGWALAAFSGSAIAVYLGRRGQWTGWVVAGLFLLATIANFYMIPHPVWMVLASITAIAAAAWLGCRLGARWTTEPQPTSV